MTSTPVATDGELADPVAGDVQQAFSERYDRHYDSAYDFAARIVRDRDLAADVVQTAFIRAWEALQGDQRPRRFKAWLYTIARNRAIDELRRGRR